jgi:hypothetical protein
VVEVLGKKKSKGEQPDGEKRGKESNFLFPAHSSLEERVRSLSKLKCTLKPAFRGNFQPDMPILFG